jgi:segregation and condensation protein A
MPYKIKLNIFEGPFDLLVYLIQRAEMNIYDIEISLITKQYLDHIRIMEENDVAVGSDFLVLAASLIELKSKMLLPRITPEGETLEDPRTDLADKIAEYIRFKNLSDLLEARRELAALRLAKPQEDLLPYTGEPDVLLRMDTDDFIAAFRAFMRRRKKNEELKRIHETALREQHSLTRKVGFIEKLLRSAKQKVFRFRELLSEASSKYDRLVTFIAILDMAKDGKLRAAQPCSFGEIEVKFADAPPVSGIDGGTEG